MCDRWLSKDSEDGRVDVHLTPATEEQLRDMSHALNSQTRATIFDDHLWLSVAYRPNISSFTRLQRLSCCLSLLFLSMISNAMWYDTGTTQVEAIRIGKIEFTVHELYVSAMTSITVFPATLLIVSLFRYSDRQYGCCSGGCCCRRHVSGRILLPHWCLYLGWFLVFLSVAASGFFTVLYSFEWGGEKSKEWLVAMILAALESIFLVDPSKVSCFKD